MYMGLNSTDAMELITLDGCDFRRKLRRAFEENSHAEGEDAEHAFRLGECIKRGESERDSLLLL
jgi:hypothetical protein